MIDDMNNDFGNNDENNFDNNDFNGDNDSTKRNNKGKTQADYEENTKKNYENGKSHSEVNNEAKKTKEMIDSINRMNSGEGAQNHMSEETEQNKTLASTFRNISEKQKKIYDYLAINFGIDLYNIESKRGIKKAFEKLNNVKNIIKNTEKKLEGREVYKMPTAYNESLIKYVTSVDPKRKGLYFKEQEIKDITILYKNKEQDYLNNINVFENKISELNGILKDSSANYSADTLNDLRRQRINLTRLVDGQKQMIKEINYEMNKHIVEYKIIKNEILKNQNMLNASRDLSNFVEMELKIIDAEQSSKTSGNTGFKNLKELEKIGSDIMTDLKDYIDVRNNSIDSLYSKIDKINNNEEGSKFFDDALNKNQARFNESSANSKAMRDAYFKDLGF